MKGNLPQKVYDLCIHPKNGPRSGPNKSSGVINGSSRILNGPKKGPQRVPNRSGWVQNGSIGSQMGSVGSSQVGWVFLVLFRSFGSFWITLDTFGSLLISCFFVVGNF